MNKNVFTDTEYGMPYIKVLLSEAWTYLLGLG